MSWGRGRSPGSSPGRVEAAVRLRRGPSHLKWSVLEGSEWVLLWKGPELTRVSGEAGGGMASAQRGPGRLKKRRVQGAFKSWKT